MECKKVNVEFLPVSCCESSATTKVVAILKQVNVKYNAENKHFI